MINRRKLLSWLGLGAGAAIVAPAAAASPEPECPHNNIWYLGSKCYNSGNELAICKECDSWVCCDQSYERKVI